MHSDFLFRSIQLWHRCHGMVSMCSFPFPIKLAVKTNQLGSQDSKEFGSLLILQNLIGCLVICGTDWFSGEWCKNCFLCVLFSNCTLPISWRKIQGAEQLCNDPRQTLIFWGGGDMYLGWWLECTGKTYLSKHDSCNLCHPFSWIMYF